MSIKDEIEKPKVTLVYADSGTIDPTHCVFDVEINFKDVNGVAPYPPLVYTSERKSIETSESQGPELISTMMQKAQKHKDKYEFLKAKQAIVDNAVSAWYGGV